jgi:hypothetical protein
LRGINCNKVSSFELIGQRKFPLVWDSQVSWLKQRDGSRKPFVNSTGWKARDEVVIDFQQVVAGDISVIGGVYIADLCQKSS